MSDLLAGIGFCKQQRCLQNAPIRSLIRPVEKDLGGFSVRRLMPSDQLRSVGPFIFFDHIGPARFPQGAGIDVRPHPHIGLATITYLFDGRILHRDNLGNVQAIKPATINWMTAGKGIVHSERTPPEERDTEHSTHGLQLWIALPQEQEETEPDFIHYEADRFIRQEMGKATVRVLIGDAYGIRSPVRTFSPTLYVEASLEKGAAIVLPQGSEERAVYVVSGSVQVQGATIDEHSLAVFDQSPLIKLTAEQETRLVIIGGQPLGKRIVWWNLVASRRELIDKAKASWKEGRYPKIPGETEFIPLPENR